MKQYQFLLLLIILPLKSHCQTQTDSISGYSIAQKMFEIAPSIRSLTYTITKQERIDGEMIKQISYTKMIKSPLHVYLRQEYPKKGQEVLFVEGENGNKATINPNGFPWINLSLDPMDGLMRNNQHHTIFQSGFDHVISILQFLSNKYADQLDEMILYNGMVDYQDELCHAIKFVNPHFAYIDYEVESNETVETIASKLKLSEFMIMDLNPNLDEFDDISEGQIIRIPNDYSNKMNLLIHTQTFIPLRMEVYDPEGLYELYEYKNVVINPDIPLSEFSKDFEQYDF